MKTGIYTITNTINGKRYIGSSKDIFARWIAHKGLLRRNKHQNKHLQSAWNKYGETAFEFKVVAFVMECELITTESRLISLWNTDKRHNGYNKREPSTLSFTQETISKMRDSAKTYWDNPEHRKAAADRQTGRKYSEETKSKVGIASKKRWDDKDTRATIICKQKEYTKTEEHRNNLSKSLKGRKLSDAHKLAISISNKGRHCSIETRRKMSESHKRRAANKG